MLRVLSVMRRMSRIQKSSPAIVALSGHRIPRLVTEGAVSYIH